MMEKDLVVLAASAGVVAFMVAIAALLGFRERAIISEASLARDLALSEPRARIESAAIDAKGRAALAKLSDGRLLAAIVMADGVTLRIYAPDAVRLKMGAGKVSARFGDLGFPALNISLAEPPAWLAALGDQK
jgi:hypothetical protein